MRLFQLRAVARDATRRRQGGQPLGGGFPARLALREFRQVADLVARGQPRKEREARDLADDAAQILIDRAAGAGIGGDRVRSQRPRQLARIGRGLRGRPVQRQDAIGAVGLRKTGEKRAIFGHVLPHLFLSRTVPRWTRGPGGTRRMR